MEGSRCPPYRLQIDPVAPIDVTVGLGGPAEIPFGGTGTYLVTLDNTGNLDLPYVLLTFGIPRVQNPSDGLIPGEALTFTSSLGGAPLLTGVPFSQLSTTLNRNGNLLATGFAFDLRVDGKAALSFNVRMYEGLDELLRQNPKFLEDLTPEERERLSFDFWIMASATPMTSADYVSTARRGGNAPAGGARDLSAPGALRNFAANSTAWGDAYLLALRTTGQLRPEDAPPAASLDPKLTGVVRTAVAGLLGMEVAAATIGSELLPAFFASVRTWLGDTPDAYGSGGTFPNADQFDPGLTYPNQFITFKIRAGEPETSFQVALPGQTSLGDLFGVSGANSQRVGIIGPAGAGQARFIPANTPVAFTINYTHDPSAAASLKELRLVQAIPSGLDPRRFLLGDLVIGDLRIDLPDGRPSFSGEFDFTSSHGFVLQVSAGIDANSGIATWLLRAVDPFTGLPISSASAGLLRPGQTASVGYSTWVQPSAVTGDIISTRVRAFAGSEAPVDSNELRYTVDAVAPVTVFTVTPSGGNLYLVEWSVTDAAGGAGVADSAVYVSADGGPFSTLLRRTTEKSFLFTGFAEREYTFLVLSSDLAGNVEAAPAGLQVPAYNPAVNLGTSVNVDSATPRAPPLTEDPAAEAPASELFRQALTALNGVVSVSRAPLFTGVRNPFTVAAFASGIPQSGAGVGGPGCGRGAGWAAGLLLRRSRPQFALEHESFRRRRDAGECARDPQRSNPWARLR
jgi:hypothetical protein